MGSERSYGPWCVREATTHIRFQLHHVEARHHTSQAGGAIMAKPRCYLATLAAFLLAETMGILP
jgi:hypothetical protein